SETERPQPGVELTEPDLVDLPGLDTGRGDRLARDPDDQRFQSLVGQRAELRVPPAGDEDVGTEPFRQGHAATSQSSATVNRPSVTPRNLSTVTPGAVRTRTNPPSTTSKTARSVITRFTTPTPVNGSVHSRTIFGSPFFVRCVVSTTTRRAPETRSMAPPIPLTIVPGMLQLARSPLSETCMAPRIETSPCPPRIMANDAAESKTLPPGRIVTVCLPALIRSASSSPS